MSYIPNFEDCESWLESANTNKLQHISTTICEKLAEVKNIV